MSLTTFQQKLINELTNEFKKLNPKPQAKNGVARFTVGTIDNCINEEERVRQTISKHNLTMAKVFLNQFKEDLKAFKKEFGKISDVQIGYATTSNYSQKHTAEELEGNVKKQPLYSHKSNEMYLFIVSKSKVFDMGDSRYNYCNNKKYIQLYVGFKTTNETVVLESGKQISLPKIVGLNYSNYNYLNDYSEKMNTATLDALIQGSKTIQQKLVELVK